SLRSALHDPVLRTEAATRFSTKNAETEAQQPLLLKAAQGALEAFSQGGFNAIVDRVPPAEREKVLGFAVPMIQLSLAELRNVARVKAGQTPVDFSGPNGAADARWTQLALLALANLPDYPAPVFMSLKNFEQV